MVDVSSIQLTYVIEGDTVTVTAVTSPEDATDRTVIFDVLAQSSVITYSQITTSTGGSCTISFNGAVGSVLITATSTDGKATAQTALFKSALKMYNGDVIFNEQSIISEYAIHSYTLPTTIPTYADPSYFFSRWTLNANGSGTKYDPGDTVITESVEFTLYAQWDLLSMSGPAVAVLSNASEYYVDPVPGAIYSWSATGTPVVTSDGRSCSVVPTVSASFTLTCTATNTYGTYTVSKDITVRSTYMITFNAYPGTVSEQTMETNAQFQLESLPAATRDGYDFGGWFTQSGGSGDQIFANTTVFSGDTDVYAFWTTGTLYLNGNGGNVYPSSLSLGDGSTVSYLPTPSYNGYDFTGWYTSSSGGTRVTVSSTFTDGQTIYAHWVKISNESEKPTCTLTISTASNSVSLFHLENVTSIEENFNVTLSEISTIIFGSQNNFIMDTGNSKKYDVMITRVNPTYYDDSQSDDRLWSNGKWYRALRDALDFWQNFAVDPVTGAKTGGFKFRFVTPDKYSELFPNLENNVFISGSLSPRYSVQKMTLTLPLQVARMTASSSSVPTYNVTYKINISGTSQSFVESRPQNQSMALSSCPNDWVSESNGAAFAGWSLNSNGSGTIYYPGDSYYLGANTTFYATWKYPVSAIIFSNRDTVELFGNQSNMTLDSGTKKITINSSGQVLIVAVGAGAAGGKGTLSTDTKNSTCGGGGSSGDTTQTNRAVSRGDVLTYSIGTCAANSNGNPTVVTIGGSEIARASGGNKGEMGSFSGSYPIKVQGGAAVGNGGKGGNSGYGNSSSVTNGENGGIGSGNIASSGGTGGVSVIAENLVGSGIRCGGGGGAAAALNTYFTVNGQRTPTYRSTGGNGGYYGDYPPRIDRFDPTSGSLGGGCGGNTDSSSIAGSDGFLAVLFFND